MTSDSRAYGKRRPLALPCVVMITDRIRLAQAHSALGPPVAAEDDRGPQRSILMVAPSWPFPPTWGFAVRVWHLARRLAARHRVTLLTYGGRNATGEDR